MSTLRRPPRPAACARFGRVRAALRTASRAALPAATLAAGTLLLAPAAVRAQGAAPRPALDTAALLAPVRAFAEAFNRDASGAAAPAAPAGVFTADVVITDDLPPFRWTGADALPRWWAELFGATPERRAEFARMSRRMLLGPVRHLFVQGGEGYVTLPATMTLTDPRTGRPASVSGDLAFTLRAEGGGWRLSSHAWTRRETAR